MLAPRGGVKKVLVSTRLGLVNTRPTSGPRGDASPGPCTTRSELSESTKMILPIEFTEEVPYDYPLPSAQVLRGSLAAPVQCWRRE